MQRGPELDGHPLSIHNDPTDSCALGDLFIACENGGQPDGQMLIPSVGGSKQGMSLCIMQQHQRTASQDCCQPPNQPSGNERVAVNGFTMSIDVTGERFGWLGWFL